MSSFFEPPRRPVRGECSRKRLCESTLRRQYDRQPSGDDNLIYGLVPWATTELVEVVARDLGYKAAYDAQTKKNPDAQSTRLRQPRHLAVYLRQL